MNKQTKNEKLILAKEAFKKAGLYIAEEKDIDRLAEVAADAYEDYPLHNWFSGGRYDAKASELIMKISLKTMINDAVIFADCEEINGFAVILPPGFTGSKTLPFLLNGGIELILHSGLSIIGRLLSYETFAMKIRKKLTNYEDWYFYNLSVSKKSQGKGIATKLFAPAMKFCLDTDGLCYLETNKATNVDIYKHYGFKLRIKGTVPKSDVKHYAMTKKL